MADTQTPSPRGENAPSAQNTTPRLRWRAPRLERYHRTWKWYAVTGSIAGLCVLYSIVTQAWTFTLTLVLGIGLYLWVHRSPPKEYDIAITDDGILFDDTLHRWGDLKGFWILVGQQYAQLHIERNQALLPTLVVRTGDADPYAIRDLLAENIPEMRDRKEKLIDNIIRICKL